MRLGSERGSRAALTAAIALLLAAPPSRAEEEPGAPPTAERVQLDEMAGRTEEALEGWAARATRLSGRAERMDALKRYVALAEKSPASPDAWLVDSLQRSGAGLVALAGRRVVVVAPDDVLAGADAKRVAALCDAYALAVERLCGARAPVTVLARDDKRPRDRAGRYLLAVRGIPAPVADQAFDSWTVADQTHRGPALAHLAGRSLTQACVRVAANRRAQLLDPAVTTIVLDAAAREVGEPAGIALAAESRKRAKERHDAEWAPGCLPASAANSSTLLHLLGAAFDAERAAQRDPSDSLRAFLAAPRRDVGWPRSDAAGPRELAWEPLSTVLAPASLEVLRRGGLVPCGGAFDAMKRRVAADDLAREAASLAGDDSTRGPAARTYFAAAAALQGDIGADELTLDGLLLQEREDAKAARAAAKKLGLVEGFDFLGPLPEVREKDEPPASARLLPLAVATAEGRFAFRCKEPVEVSLKWDEVKPDPWAKLVHRTPWGDRRGNWGGAVVAALRWTKDVGAMLRLRPPRDDWAEITVLADGVVCERWPDGSVLVPGAKGTTVVLASPSRLTCSVPWREQEIVQSEIAAAAEEPDPVRALRPWAERRVAMALPRIAEALLKLPDADLVREIVLLAPFRGGDAATCDALLAHANSRPQVLAAYLDVCRGSRDPALLDRLVALALAPDASEETVVRVQYALDGALFRKVTEKGPALAALWEKGRKWLAGAAFAEGETIRDLHDAAPCFAPAADAAAWGRACLAPTGANRNRGVGYLGLDVPEGNGSVWMTVRWRGGRGARLALRGVVTDGKKTKPFVADLPAPARDDPQWALDVFDLGSLPRGRVALVIDDPCAAGASIDAIAVGAKPLE